jgi:hypothetical protein
MSAQSPPWAVSFAGQSKKQKENLPEDIVPRLLALQLALEWKGPERKEWPHYGPVRGKKKNEDYRHCHLNKSQPVYVVVWKVISLERQIMEIRYVGTHEKAYYRRIN